MNAEKIKPKNYEYPTKSLESVGVKLLDCVHKTPKPTSSGYPYIAIPNIKDGRLDLNDVRFISEKDYQEWTKKTTPIPGDIILTRRARVGDIAVIPENFKCAIGQNLVILRSNEKQVLQKYLKWALRGPLYEQEVQRYLNVGAVFNSLNCKDIPKFKISVPMIAEQNEITDILDSLDDKKDLNNQMNSTLEEIAQTLFKHWFIDFEFPDENGNPYRSSGGRMVDSELGEIPEGWKIKELSTFGRIICGKTPSKKETQYYENGEFSFIKIPDIRDQVFPIKTEDKLSKDGAESILKKKLPPFSVCVSCIATVGMVCLTYEESYTNQQINSIIPNEDYSSYYLYFEMKELNEKLNLWASGGSATLNLNTNEFSKIKIVNPSREIVHKFYNIVDPIFKKILSNSLEIEKLSNTRDSLLPKLISGKIRIQI